MIDKIFTVLCFYEADFGVVWEFGFESNALKMFVIFQFQELEEKLNQREFEMEDLQGELGRRAKTISDAQQSMADMRVELATTTEQRNTADKEVSCLGF